jgi:hypothetical protein
MFENGLGKSASLQIWVISLGFDYFQVIIYIKESEYVLNPTTYSYLYALYHGLGLGHLLRARASWFDPCLKVRVLSV